jgi:SAM-dependent methyltransferase
MNSRAVAGLADPATGRPVTPETVFYNFSIGKGAASTIAHRLVERGLFGYDTPVVELWWEPGTQVGYHPYTFGYLVGEVARRATGKPISQLLREEVSERAASRVGTRPRVPASPSPRTACPATSPRRPGSATSCSARFVAMLRSRVFGQVADVYDRVRPGYPEQLVDDVLGYADGAPAPALEVGAGTGKATAAFAARSLPVTALEPDPRMAAVLRRQVAGVTVIVSPFEEYRPPHRFGLLYCADAWHWTDPAVRWQRAADALRDGGTLALFWHGDRFADDAVRAAFLDVHHRCAPDLTPEELRSPPPGQVTTTWPYTELVAVPEFGDVDVREYPWRLTLSRTDYLALQSTRSVYRIMPEEQRNTVFDALGRALPDEVALAVTTTLYLARRG